MEILLAYVSLYFKLANKYKIQTYLLILIESFNFFPLFLYEKWVVYHKSKLLLNTFLKGLSCNE